MTINTFFRFLNRKIKQYEKAVSKPYKKPTYNVTVIWVEDVNKNTKD